MLHDEHDVVDHHQYPQRDLHVVYINFLSEYSFQQHLQEGERAARQVHEDVEDRPAPCGLSLVVPVNLRQVLQRGDAQLEVPHEAEHAQLRPHIDCLGLLSVNISTIVRVE